MKSLPLPPDALQAASSKCTDPLKATINKYRAWEQSLLGNKPAGSGVLEIEKVIHILEQNNIPCCLVGTSALIYYGASRVRGDWQICVPTDLLNTASALLESHPHSNNYIPALPLPIPQVGSLLHMYPRFKCKDYQLFFVVLPSRDCRIRCQSENLQRSSNNLPYPKLDVFIQALLDTHDMIALCDIVDGSNVSEEWGEDNLELSGSGDMDWAAWKNALIRGKEPFSLNEVQCCVVNRKATWEEIVRGKHQRLSWKFPKEQFTTRFRLRDSIDPWLIHRDFA